MKEVTVEYGHTPDSFPDTQSSPQQARKNLARLSDVLTSGESQIAKHEELGEIYIDKGITGKSGFGLLHIIEDRSRKDNFNENEITALLYKVVDSVENGKITVGQPKIIDGRNVGRMGIEKDGIIGFVSRVRGDKDEKFVITGFAIDKKMREATEAIQTVIARYGYTPEFSDIRKQVGAAVSSLQQVSPQFIEKSSRQIEQAKKAGYVQGVCECVAVVGDDHVLGKKLLTGMKVTRDMAKQYAHPDTYKALEQGIFAPQEEQKQGRARGIK